MIKGAHYLVRGRVQGVGFRMFVADAARTEGIRGWVRNLADGAVEVQAEGEADALGRFHWRLRQGPPMARVEEVATEDVEPSGATAFRIV